MQLFIIAGTLSGKLFSPFLGWSLKVSKGQAQFSQIGSGFQACLATTMVLANQGGLSSCKAFLIPGPRQPVSFFFLCVEVLHLQHLACFRLHLSDQRHRGMRLWGCQSSQIATPFRKQQLATVDDTQGFFSTPLVVCSSQRWLRNDFGSTKPSARVVPLE